MALYRPRARPRRPLPGKLGALLESFGPTLSADQMKQFLQAAKSQGTSADTIADQIGSGQGPFAQLGPRMGEGASVLVEALDRKDVAAFNRRANGVVNVGSHELAAMNPSNAGQTPATSSRATTWESCCSRAARRR